MKLGTLLLRNAAIGLSQLEAALRNQVLYGGRLGTNLVELGYLDLELLSQYLAELSGLPVATQTLLDGADGSLLDRLGSDDAHRLRVVPLGLLGEGGAVAIAMVEPGDAAAREEVAARLGAVVAPYVVPELRALYYLEKHFGLPRRARFVRSGRPGSEGEPGLGSERRRSQPVHGLVLPPAFTLEPRRRRASTATPSASPAAVEPIAISFATAAERIDTAPHRERIAEAFVDFARGRCAALVVFLVRDGNALGWRGHVAPPAAPLHAIESLSLPLGGASALQSAHDTGQPFAGPPPSAARPVEKQLWAALGEAIEPAEVIAVPVLVKARAVQLIYAHTAGTSAAALAGELSDLAARAQTAYLRLIRQARS